MEPVHESESAATQAAIRPGSGGMTMTTIAALEVHVPLLLDVRNPYGVASRSYVGVPMAIPATRMPVVGRFLKGADLEIEYRGRDGTPFRTLHDPLSPQGGNPDAIAERIGRILQSRFMPPLGHQHSLTGKPVRNHAKTAGAWGDLDHFDLSAASPYVELARQAAWRNFASNDGVVHVATPFPVWHANPETNSVALDEPSFIASGFVANGQFGIGRLRAATAYVEAFDHETATRIHGAVQSIDPDYDRVDDLATLATALASRIEEEIGVKIVDLPTELVGAFHDVDATRRGGVPIERDRARELLTGIVRLRDWIESPDGADAPGHGRLEREWRKCRMRLQRIEGIVPASVPTSARPGAFR